MADLLTSVAGAATSITGVLLAFVIFAAVAVLLFYLWKQNQRFNQFNVEIWQKDGFGQLTVRYDKGGIFVDTKTNNKRLFLKANNVGLNPDNVPYLMTGSGRKKVYLLQTGLKNFQYIKPVVSDTLLHFSVGEEDVNWAINSYEKQKKLFSQGWLAQYLPYMMIAFSGMIVLILVIQVLNKFEVLKEVADTLLEVSKNLAQARSGTTVIQP